MSKKKVKDPRYTIDNSLKRYIGITSQEKIDEANETLEKYRMPDIYYIRNKHSKKAMAHKKKFDS